MKNSPLQGHNINKLSKEYHFAICLVFVLFVRKSLHLRLTKKSNLLSIRWPVYRSTRDEVASAFISQTTHFRRMPKICGENQKIYWDGSRWGRKPSYHNFKEVAFCVVVSADHRAEMPVIAFNDTEELLYEWSGAQWKRKDTDNFLGHGRRATH
jgi:hypothetical protein